MPYKRFSADGQSIAQSYSTMRVMVTVLFWTAVCTQKFSTANHSEEVENAVAALKRGKSEGVDNIPSGLVQAGRESVIDV